MIEWFYPNNIPTERSPDFKIFSVEVLIYLIEKNLRSIGWYNYRDGIWIILSHEKNQENFAWRFFRDDIDNDFRDTAKLRWYGPKEIPDILKSGNDDESVDILIYTYTKKYHAIGNFSYLLNEWQSIFHEKLHHEFYWRYFESELDEYTNFDKF